MRCLALSPISSSRLDWVIKLVLEFSKSAAACERKSGVEGSREDDASLKTSMASLIRSWMDWTSFS